MILRSHTLFILSTPSECNASHVPYVPILATNISIAANVAGHASHVPDVPVLATNISIAAYVVGHASHVPDVPALILAYLLQPMLLRFPMRQSNLGDPSHLSP